MNKNQSQNEDNNKIKQGFMGLSTNNNNNNNFSYGKEIVKKIPLIGEKFDITKKIEETQLILAKKWVTSTKKMKFQ